MNEIVNNFLFGGDLCLREFIWRKFGDLFGEHLCMKYI